MKVGCMKWCVYTAAVALLGMLCSTAFSATPEQSGFSAVQGVNAQALSVEEMQAVSGQLNAYDIAAALTAEAPKLANYPKLQSLDLQLASWYQTNAVAINAAFQKLDAEQRHFIRLHYLDGVTLQEIGRLQQVDRSTASRWVSAARDFLLSEVRRQLGEEFHLTGATIDTLIRALQSQLDVSLGALRK